MWVLAIILKNTILAQLLKVETSNDIPVNIITDSRYASSGINSNSKETQKRNKTIK